ncbi:MAG: hypothetical protein M0Z94_10530 [Dehalococcoidales bacterium]|nr:hypothetical protein [Dehalococcoidales bacterium]
MPKKSNRRAATRSKRRDTRQAVPATAPDAPAVPMEEGGTARESDQPVRAATATTAPRVQPARRGGAASSPVKIDYSYVKRDLRRIGLLSGFIALVLAGLTFVLR